MRITIDGLHITVEKPDGSKLEFDLSDAGLTATTQTLVIETGVAAELTLTIPFKAAGG